MWFFEIEASCPNCNKEKPFHNTEEVIRSSGGMRSTAKTPRLKSGIQNFEFKCVSCRSKITVWLNVKVKESSYILEKVGEMPRQSLNRDASLQKFFSNDLDCYEKALVSITHGYGIGAFAYMRRITENHIGLLLELVEEEMKASSTEPKLIKKLGKLRDDSPMSEKIQIANEAVPSYLNPNGLNPLGRIYKALSEGIHARSEPECLESATDLMECLKYLISELTDRSKNRNRYLKTLNKL